MGNLELFIGLLLLALFAVCLWIPVWWAVSRMDSRISQQSLIRVPVSVGIALVAYLTFVNLFGKLLNNSLQAAEIYLVLNLFMCAALLWKYRSQLDVTYLWRRKRTWLGVLLIAILLALPQWFQAVSGNRWDEMASSSIHVTAPNQFAEGVFPPRHNAFPNIVIKYHYGFTLLSGTVHWITRLSSNVSIDVVSTALWFFIFLFTFAWMRQLGISRIASIWSGFAILMGGGLSWLYLPWLQAYKGFYKVPPDSALIRSYDSEVSWWGNLFSTMENPSIYLRNADGNIFSLPFDVAIQFQQHAVALGIALALVAAYVFWLWQTRRNFAPVLLAVNIFCFGLVFLGHAVFGAMACASAGLVLLILWLFEPSRIRFYQGILFTIGVSVIAFLHGGMLAIGDEYGPGLPIAIRDGFGFISGSLIDQVNWILASFGLLLIFTFLSLWIWWYQRHTSQLRNVFLVFFSVFALVSFMIPQMLYFSHAGGVEEQTEITKFFYCTHFSIAILSVIGVDYLSKRFSWWMILPFFVMTAITPLAVSIAGTQNKEGGWAGFYRSPYDLPGVSEDYKAAGEALRSLKKSNRDQYYDFSTEEVRSGYLNELLVYGGSVFSLSPTRYEITGFGFLIAEDQVANRILLESGMARLLPGAAEASGTRWIYTVANQDLAGRPTIVRSRFAKLVSDGMLVKRFTAGRRQLFEFAADTHDLDQGIEINWEPKIIVQNHADWDGDGKTDLLFFDYLNQNIIFDEEIISLAGYFESQSEFPLIFLARFPGDERADLLMGHMSDAEYSRGETISAMVRQYPFHWRRLDSQVNRWQQSYQYGFWSLPTDVPLVADHDGDGFDSQLAYRQKSGQWFLYPNQRIDGPSLPAPKSPLPVVGRFLPGSIGDLAVWSPIDGQFKVISMNTGETAMMAWGGREGDILLPGDYDGDGYDEVGIWQPHSNTWWVRNMPSGPNLEFTFGTSTGIPLPTDYDGDGQIDLAFWEPKERKIYVSFDFGQSVGKVIQVPPHSIPAFVHMY